MGFLSSIDIKLEKKLDKSFFLFDLVSNKWRYDDHGKVTYIKLNEIDYDWTQMPLPFENRMLEEILEKNEMGEDIGVVITYNDTNIGGQLIYFQKSNTVSFLLNINRQVINNTNKTDFDWYKLYYSKMFEKYIIKAAVYNDERDGV